MRSYLETLWETVEAALTAAAFAEERDFETAREVLANAKSSDPVTKP